MLNGMLNKKNQTNSIIALTLFDLKLLKCFRQKQTKSHNEYLNEKLIKFLSFLFKSKGTVLGLAFYREKGKPIC